MGGFYTTWLASDVINNDFQLLPNRISMATDILIYWRLNKIDRRFVRHFKCISVTCFVFLFKFQRSLISSVQLTISHHLLMEWPCLKNAKLGDHNQRWHMFLTHLIVTRPRWQAVPVVFEWDSHLVIAYEHRCAMVWQCKDIIKYISWDYAIYNAHKLS